MSEPFLGQVSIVGFNFAPTGWALCNGQTLPINQNQALFSILGTTYGGDGRTTFSLPNLQGRTPVYVGNGITLGQSGGEATHTLTVSELPSHSHVPNASSAAATAGDPTGNVWAAGNKNLYATSSNSSLAATAVANQGGGQAHNNMPPYAVLNFIIALTGIFPSRN